MRAILISMLLVGGLLGCGGDDPAPAATPAPAAATPEDAPREEMKGVTRGGGKRVEDNGDRPPAFARVGLVPPDPTAATDIEAIAELSAGSPYTDISFTWLVNDREVLGYTRPILPASKRAFRKGDRVRVIARAKDEKNREAIMEGKDIVVLNSTPEIVTDLRDARRMDGVRLKAEDLDDDELVWTLKDGPPGVSIDRKGRIAVRQVNMREEWKGEVVFSVSDPDGASAELHIPVAISASKDGYTEEKQETRRVELEKMDRERLDKAALEDAERVGNMSDEEFKKYMDEREARGDAK